jgi:hypothetical protein
MKEIEITKWIIRVDESKKKEMADLIGLDKDGNEYTFQYFDGADFRKQDIICTTKE